ncbi:hypothetical protein HMPREF0281_02592 [Corynebacterium ammoniagenes DSM 20306]|uniref:Uncharacterized protein n=1 Tax=Corynebacterium ammoniagenes DSM 20306 TaxID=649754 RepID=A0ABP2ID12_CORAM|nr:hypothetical protein HMPREF0281_02592 [Corynebacterium ammoniagenes DSM 20306]
MRGHDFLLARGEEVSGHRQALLDDDKSSRPPLWCLELCCVLFKP